MYPRVFIVFDLCRVRLESWKRVYGWREQGHCPGGNTGSDSSFTEKQKRRERVVGEGRVVSINYRFRMVLEK